MQVNSDSVDTSEATPESATRHGHLLSSGRIAQHSEKPRLDLTFLDEEELLRCTQSEDGGSTPSSSILDSDDEDDFVAGLGESFHPSREDVHSPSQVLLISDSSLEPDVDGGSEARTENVTSRVDLEIPIDVARLDSPDNERVPVKVVDSEFNFVESSPAASLRSFAVLDEVGSSEREVSSGEEGDGNDKAGQDASYTVIDEASSFEEKVEPEGFEEVESAGGEIIPGSIETKIPNEVSLEDQLNSCSEEILQDNEDTAMFVIGEEGGSVKHSFAKLAESCTVFQESKSEGIFAGESEFYEKPTEEGGNNGVPDQPASDTDETKQPGAQKGELLASVVHEGQAEEEKQHADQAETNAAVEGTERTNAEEMVVTSPKMREETTGNSGREEKTDVGECHVGDTGTSQREEEVEVIGSNRGQGPKHSRMRTALLKLSADDLCQFTHVCDSFSKKFLATGQLSNEDVSSLVAEVEKVKAKLGEDDRNAIDEHFVCLLPPKDVVEPPGEMANEEVKKDLDESDGVEVVFQAKVGMASTEVPVEPTGVQVPAVDHSSGDDSEIEVIFDAREHVATRATSSTSNQPFQSRKRRLGEVGESVADSGKEHEPDAKRICDDEERKVFNDAVLTVPSKIPESEKADVLSERWNFWKIPQTDAERLEAVEKHWGRDPCRKPECRTFVSEAHRANIKTVNYHTFAMEGRDAPIVPKRRFQLEKVSPLFHYNLTLKDMRDKQREKVSEIVKDAQYFLQSKYHDVYHRWMESLRMTGAMFDTNQIRSECDVMFQNERRWTVSWDNHAFRQRWFSDVFPLQQEEAHVRRRLIDEAEKEQDIFFGKNSESNTVSVESFLNTRKTWKITHNYIDIYKQKMN